MSSTTIASIDIVVTIISGKKNKNEKISGRKNNKIFDYIGKEEGKNHDFNE